MTTKLELMRSNYLKKLLTEIVPALAENSPEAALVVVSDPPVDDVLTYVRTFFFFFLCFGDVLLAYVI